MHRTNISSSIVALITLVSLGALLGCSSSGGDDNANSVAGSGGTSAGETGLGGVSTSGASGSVSSSGAGGATTNGGAAGSSGATTNGGAAGSGGAAGATTNGGAAGSSGATTNGGAAGSAGTTPNGGSGGATAGSGGSAGAAPCGGCAVLSAPLAASGDAATAQIVFNSADFTGVTVTVRACVVAGDAHSIFKVYVQDGVTENYIGNYNAGQLYETMDTISSCSVGMQDLTVTVAASDSSDAFVSTDVSALTIQITTDGTGPWVPSVVDIDSIVLSPAVAAVGPWDFASDASPLALQGTPVAGSTLTWIP